MEQQLLAMLNSASSRPTALPSPGEGTKSPKEATPPPPPQSLAFSPPPGTLSIQDLFKTLQSPPVASPAPPVNAGQHQDRLLNMLKGLGQPADSPAPATPSSELQVGQNGENEAKEMSSNAANLLRMFNKPAEPVIEHSLPRPGSSQELVGAAQPQAPPAQPKPATEPSKATPPPPETQTPSKSIFDFVSPFDAFDKVSTPSKTEPRSKPTTPAPRAVPSPAQATTSAMPSQGSPATAHIKKERADSPASAQELTKSEKKKRPEVHLPYKAGTVVGKASGQGARSLSSHTVIDISQPGLDGLNNEDGTVTIVPASLIKRENVGYAPGRNVASTGAWMGYSMSRGRIRLIERHSGYRILLSLPAHASAAPQLDLAHTEDRIAVLACDGTLVVWAVPKSWAGDDVHCPIIAAIAPSLSSKAFSIQWVNRDGLPSLLAVGGQNGVVLLDPSKVGGRLAAPVPFAQAIIGKKVLKPEGTMAAFCLNKAHGALGVISTDSHLTLYSVASESPVWARALPSSASSAPTSVAFCETQILVGRENNTLLELVQITTEVAVLSSIRFTSPTHSPLHFAQPVYDARRCVLWVTNFARASIYGFHFALRGQPPVTNAAASHVVAFDRVLELPLEPVLSFVISEHKEGVLPEEAPLHLYYSTPTGVADAFVEPAVLAGLLEGEGVKPVAKVVKKARTDSEAKEVKEMPKVAEAKETPKKKVQAAKVAEQSSPELELRSSAQKPVIKKETEFSVPPPATAAPAPAPAPTPAPVPAWSPAHAPVLAPASAATSALASSHASIDPEILSKALKKTEDGLSNKMKQLLTKEIAGLASRIDASQHAESGVAVERQADLADKITAQVESSLKGTVAAAVREEIQSILPVLENITRQEVRDAVGKTSAAQVALSMQSLPKEIEKVLAPTLARTFTQTLHPIVERSVHDMVSQTLVPSYTQITSQMYDQLSKDIRSEMLDIRKSIVSEQSDALASTQALVVNMANSLTTLSSRVQQLSEQLARQQQPAPLQQRAPMAPLAPSAPHAPVAPHVPAAPFAPVAPAPIAPNALPVFQPATPGSVDLREAEQHFLAALASPDQPRSFMDLLRGYFSATEELLPRDRKSPLSQAVLLSLLHRLATVLAEAPPLEEGFNMALAWMHRVARLIDTKDPEIALYLPRVNQAIQGHLRTATLRLGPRGEDQGPGARALGAIQQVNTFLADKLAA